MDKNKKKYVVIGSIVTLLFVGVVFGAFAMGGPGPREVTERWIELCINPNKYEAEIRKLLVIKGKRSVELSYKDTCASVHDHVVNIRKSRSGKKAYVTIQDGANRLKSDMETYGMYERTITLVETDEGWLIDEIGDPTTVIKKDNNKFIEALIKYGG